MASAPPPPPPPPPSQPQPALVVQEDEQMELSGLEWTAATTTRTTPSTTTNNNNGELLGWHTIQIPRDETQPPPTAAAAAAAEQPIQLPGGSRSFQAAVVVTAGGEDDDVGPNPSSSSSRNSKKKESLIVLGGEETSLQTKGAVGFTDSVMIWDVQTGEWREGPRLNHPRYGLTVVKCNCALFALGGYFQNKCLDTIERISIADLLAYDQKNYATASGGAAAAATEIPMMKKTTTTKEGNKTTTKIVYERVSTEIPLLKKTSTTKKGNTTITIVYEPATNSNPVMKPVICGWKIIPARLTTPREGCCAVAVRNRYIVVMGGTHNGIDRLQSVDVIDTGRVRTTTTTTKGSGSSSGNSSLTAITVRAGPLLNEAHLYGTAAATNTGAIHENDDHDADPDRLFIVGGESLTGARSNVVESLPLWTKTTTKTTLSVGATSSSSGPTSSGTAGGGGSITKTSTKISCALAPLFTTSSGGGSSSSKRWRVQEALQLSTARAGHAMVSVGHCLIVAGGQGNGFDYLSSVEVLDTKRKVSWQWFPNMIVPRFGCSMVYLSTYPPYSFNDKKNKGGILVLGGCSGNKEENQGYEDLAVLVEYMGIAAKKKKSTVTTTSTTKPTAATMSPGRAPIETATTMKDQFQLERQELSRVIQTKSKKPCRVSYEYIDSILTEKKLGEGFFGVVYQGKDVELRKIFAIKMVHPDTLEHGHSLDVQRASETFHRELDTLNNFRHPNIACLYAYHFCATERGRHVLLFEMAENGSLDRFWSCGDVGRERLSSVSRRVQIALEIMTAIRFLHVGGKGIGKCFHRDIKSGNICLTRDFTAKLVDCGLAKFVADDPSADSSSNSSHPKGTRGYTCPKYDSGVLLKYQEACDIFSFGVVMAELWTGRLQNHKSLQSDRAVNYHEKYVTQKQEPLWDIDLFMDLNIVDVNGDIIGEQYLEDNTSLGSTTVDSTNLTMPVEFYENIPRHLVQFIDLAVHCMATEPKDRPTGDDIIQQLQSIHSKCLEYEQEFGPTTDVTSGSTCSIPDMLSSTGTMSGSTAATTVPSSMSSSTASLDGVVQTTCDACKVENMYCRLFDDGHYFCVASCWKTVMANRFVSEEYSKQTEISKMQSTMLNVMSNVVMSSLSRLEAAAIHPIPRLFILAPRKRKPGIFGKSKTWLLRRFQQRMHLHFVCAHSKEAVSPPIKLAVTREWVRKIAPALVFSLRFLSAISAAAVSGLGLDGLGQAMEDSVEMEHMIGMAEDVEELMERSGDGDIVQRIRSDQLNENDIQRINADCLDLVAERAMSAPGWKDKMTRVRRRIDPSSSSASSSVSEVLWVKKEYATLPQYEIIEY